MFHSNSIQPKDQQSARLFENQVLERLTHVHPITPLLAWAPISVYLFWRAFFLYSPAIGPAIAIALLGSIVWTLSEYILHRYLFHFPAKSRFGQWLVYLFHGVHHEAPKDKTRLLMPLAGSIPIMGLFYLLFGLLIPMPWIEVFCGGFIVGYLIYDYIHYATHHFPMHNRVAKFLKHYHLKHHYSRAGGRFGVSSNVWDRVFRSDPDHW